MSDGCSLFGRLPGHAPQRRRFSGGATLEQVYAWAQLALLQGLCPAMDAHLEELRQRPPAPALCSSTAGAPASGSGSGDARTDTAAVTAAGDVATAAESCDGGPSPPAQPDEAWVQRWSEAAAGSGSGWAWGGGWQLAQMYPRQQLPCSDDTVTEAGLVPQAALAVEQQDLACG